MYKHLLVMSLLLINLNANINSNIEILTQKELELLKCNLLSECLESATGISSINGEGDIFQATNIRGNTSVNYNANTLLLVDGIPILNPYHGSFNLDSIPLSSISKIEIIKGTSSIIYGSNAINGAINIITKNDKDKATIQSRFGSYETFLASTSLSYILAQDLSLSLFAEHTKSSGEQLLIKDELGNTKDFEQSYKNSSLIAKLKYKDLWFHTQIFQRRLPNYKTQGFIYGALDAKEENYESEYTVGIGYKHNINKNIFLKLQSIYHKWDLTKDRLEDTSQWSYDSDSFYNELETHFFTNTDSSNILGVSYEIANAHRFISESSSYDVGINDKKTYNFSLYDNGKYKLDDELDFLYAGRYFYSSYYDATLNKYANNDNFSLSTGLIYNLAKNISLKALYSQAYREPTYFEKEVNTTTLIGNSNLSPELSKTYDLILSHELESLKYSLGLFYTQLENKISRVDINSSTQMNENIGNIDYYGVELNTKFRFSKTLWGFANYSYLQTDTNSDPSIKNFTYDHMLNIAISKLFAQQYLINTSIKYLDDWGEASSYTLLNFSFDYKPKSMKNLSYEMVMKNILDEKIELPEIERANQNVATIPSMYESRIYLGLKYDF